MARTRRSFLRATGAAGAGLWLTGSLPGLRAGQDHGLRHLRIGVVGVAGQGGANLNGVAHEDVVALCDVDAGSLAGAAARFPEAATFSDYRAMVDEVELDAVVVSTPDHTHANATLAAIEAGCHVYCEKPLTRTVGQARRVTEAARAAGVASQLGTQIHARDNFRRVVELVRAGAVGAIEEVFVFCGKGWWAAGLPQGTAPVPQTLDWDLWTGPTRLLPYTKGYHPANWRRYWNFGGGTLGDMGCHYIDLPFWALGLAHCTEVEAEGPTPHPDGAPEWLHVRWGFPARGEDPPVTLHWYDGGRRPEILAEHGIDWGSGVLFVGESGLLLADYDRRVLLPATDFADHAAPAPWLAPSIGHHREWLAACRGEAETTCGFEYSGPLTETVLLGAVAFRCGRKLTWDAARLRTSDEQAQALIDPPAREGW